MCGRRGSQSIDSRDACGIDGSPRQRTLPGSEDHESWLLLVDNGEGLHQTCPDMPQMPDVSELQECTSPISPHYGLTVDGDQGTTSKDLVQVPIGPVTRARAKKFKDVLNGLIQELWAQANLWRPIEHDPRGQQRIITLIQVLEGSGQG
jgi:hypothetical protein